MMAPIAMTQSADGEWSFAAYEPPPKTWIDIQSLPAGRFIKINHTMGTITIRTEALTVVYKRIAISINDEWICERMA